MCYVISVNRFIISVMLMNLSLLVTMVRTKLALVTGRQNSPRIDELSLMLNYLLWLTVTRVRESRKLLPKGLVYGLRKSPSCRMWQGLVTVINVTSGILAVLSRVTLCSCVLVMKTKLLVTVRTSMVELKLGRVRSRIIISLMIVSGPSTLNSEACSRTSKWIVQSVRHMTMTSPIVLIIRKFTKLRPS